MQLPPKIIHMTGPHHIHWNVIYNPRPFRKWFENETASPHPAPQPRLLLSGSPRDATKIQHFALRLSHSKSHPAVPLQRKVRSNITKYCVCQEKWRLNFTKYSAPATKSDAWASRNAVPDTKSDAWLCYSLTLRLLDSAITWRFCYYWAILLLNASITWRFLYFFWMLDDSITWRFYCLTCLLLDGSITWRF